MSSINLLGLILLASAPSLSPSPLSTTHPVSCPVAFKGREPTAVSLFNGPPARLEDLVSDDNGWHFRPRLPEQPDQFLVCRYGAGRQITIRVPRAATRCTFGDKGQPFIICR